MSLPQQLPGRGASPAKRVWTRRKATQTNLPGRAITSAYLPGILRLARRMKATRGTVAAVIHIIR